MNLARLAPLAVCGALLLSCGTAQPGADTAGETTTSSPSGRTGSPGTSDPVTSPPATSAQARTPARAVPSPTGTAAVRVRRADGMVPALVTGVRVARHDGFDRVVVDFKDDIPGYAVRWTSKVETEGAGKAIDLKGGRALHVMLIPAVAHTEEGTPTWSGTSAEPLTAVTGIVSTGDFEGHVGIALISDRTRTFRVKEYTGPSRLVIDVGH
ncbi:AMIN-like domain-containing (lipo)protein [Nonomuraea glycinis]|uniref:AMIN-like domain-containing (lipo)protein n=1 Tax=Nonomuraea glycinis TaxID=2047744 RepID=UPI0033AC8057